MDVSETNLQTVLGGSKQYRVPLYQRRYSWERPQAERLWTDIQRLASDQATYETAGHFMGSLVLSLGRAGPAGTEFLVVDGQQRLTTLSVLLCALRDHVSGQEPDGDFHRQRIDELFLINKFSAGDDRLKLLPTQADREGYRAILDGRLRGDQQSNIISTYRFFRMKLREADDPEDSQDIERIEHAILNGLIFVSITTRGDDNVYRIFESLNNTGKSLDQGDLLRNYVFMRLAGEGDRVYHSTWLPMQETLAASDLQQLFWLDVVRDQPQATQSDVYSAQQRRLDALPPSAIEQEVERWAVMAGLLAIMRSPEREGHSDVRRRLHRLKAWGTTTAEPLTLQVLWRRQRGLETDESAAEALAIVESYLVRRVLIGRATAGLNRTLLGACAELREGTRAADSIRSFLSAGRKFYASDSEIDQAVHSIPLYFQGRPAQRKLILQWLEESYGSKEAADPSRATIEHVLPQTLTAEWREAISPYVQQDQTIDTLHESIVHTLGNLTLSAYNSELSNLPFARKRDLLSQSAFQLNTEIAQNTSWGPEQIRSRARALAELIKAEWPGPAPTTDTVRAGVDWGLAHRAVEALEPGEWTSYGDLAALIGTAAQPMGQHMANTVVDGAWRVLQAAGTISPGFRWYRAGDDRDPVDVLREEGVRFDGQGRADQSQRVSSETLAARLGIDVADHEFVIAASQASGEKAAAFMRILEENNPTQVVANISEVLAHWRSLGGQIDYGLGEVTTCVLLVPEEIAGQRRVRPIAIYPNHGVETAFQHLSSRPPFDSEATRDEFRRLLNRIPGVNIPVNRMRSRPSFSLELLKDPSASSMLNEALTWFFETASTIEPADLGTTGGDTDPRRITPAELAQELGVPDKEIRELLRERNGRLSRERGVSRWELTEAEADLVRAGFARR